MEGITYYLAPDTLNELFNIFGEVQTADSTLAIEYWDVSIEELPAYRKLQDYFETNFNSSRNYYLLTESELRATPGYRMDLCTSTTAQERRYSHTYCLQDFEGILPAYFAVLKRI